MSFSMLVSSGYMPSSELAVSYGASQVALVVKNPLANAGHIRDASSIPESGRSPEAGHGNPLQYSCVDNYLDRGAWRAKVHRVAKIQTQLSNFTFTFMHGRRKWQPTPAFLPGEPQGREEPGRLLSMGLHRVRHD